MCGDLDTWRCINRSEAALSELSIMIQHVNSSAPSIELIWMHRLFEKTKKYGAQDYAASSGISSLTACYVGATGPALHSSNVFAEGTKDARLRLQGSLRRQCDGMRPKIASDCGAERFVGLSKSDSATISFKSMQIFTRSFSCSVFGAYR